MSIHIDNLSFSYDAPDAPILRNLSFELAAGDICALIGKTGSGKTTLFKILAGLLPEYTGIVLLHGVSPREKTRILKRARRNRLLSQHVGYVMQKPERQLFAETVLEDVAYGPKNLGLSEMDAQEKAHRALHALGIEALAQSSPFELSGGQARLVAIAGIVSMGAPILILDEPFAGLDDSSSKALRMLMAQLKNDQHTILFTTHDMDEAARADSIALLADKNIQAHAPASDFFLDISFLERFDVALPWPLQFYRQLHNGAYDGIETGAHNGAYDATDDGDHNASDTCVKSRVEVPLDIASLATKIAHELK